MAIAALAALGSWGWDIQLCRGLLEGQEGKEKKKKLKKMMDRVETATASAAARLYKRNCKLAVL